MPLPCHALPRPTAAVSHDWAMRWKPPLNAFAITFRGRITPAGNKSMPRSDPPLIPE